MRGSLVRVGEEGVEHATRAQDLIARLRGLRVLGCGGILVICHRWALGGLGGMRRARLKGDALLQRLT